MTKKIFVSHSQLDKDIRRTFNEIISIGGLQSVCMEFEEMESPKWKEIKDKVKESETVFLLLGKNVTRKSHTNNWISFEVGLACALGKHIWVFEKAGSTIDFPIPYVTHYMPYYDLENKEVFDYIRKIIESYGENGDGNGVPYVRFTETPNTPLNHLPKGKAMTCPRCHSTFNLHSVEKLPPHLKIKTPICPLCRQVIKGGIIF